MLYSTSCKAQPVDEKTQKKVFQAKQTGIEFTATEQYSNVHFTDISEVYATEIIEKEPEDLTPKDWDTYYKKLGLAT